MQIWELGAIMDEADEQDDANSYRAASACGSGELRFATVVESWRLRELVENLDNLLHV